MQRHDAPPAPRVPSDFVYLLTYTAGPHETLAEVVAEQSGIELDGTTMVDELN